jgi:Uma2 family endonuclease
MSQGHVPQLEREDDVLYPSGDGEPMGETPIHVRAMILLFEALEDYFRDRPDVYLAADMFLYWEQGNPSACCAPDVMVIPGVGQAGGQRRSFFTWREGGAVPGVCFEMASLNTWQLNLGQRYQNYERLGVREYFIFDPLVEFMPRALTGYRRVGGSYQELIPAADGSLGSRELGLTLCPEGPMLRLLDAATGEPVLTKDERSEEERRRHLEAEQRAEQERLQREQAERRADQERQVRAEAEQRAEQERQRAEQERQRAETLAAEVERLRALLRPPGPGNGPSAS